MSYTTTVKMRNSLRTLAVIALLLPLNNALFAQADSSINQQEPPMLDYESTPKTYIVNDIKVSGSSDKGIVNRLMGF